MSDQDNITNNMSNDPTKDRVSLDAAGQQPGEDMLMAYLAGTLTPEQQHEVEKWMADEGAESDAIEGLKMLNEGERHHSIHRLNHQLHKNLNSRKKKKRTAKTDSTTIIAIITVLLLAIVAWLVIKIIS